MGVNTFSLSYQLHYNQLTVRGNVERGEHMQISQPG